MRTRRNRLAFVGVLVLALTMFAGLSVTADAAKKKKKKSAKVANVSNNTPRAIPDPGTGPIDGRLDTVLTVGKKFKGKRVDSLELRFQTTGDAPQSSSDLQVDITAPNGYRLPGDWWDNGIGNTQSIGPLTITPNNPNRTCTATVPPCSDPFRTLNRPYAGTVGDNTFAWFRGLPMRGNWIVTFLDNGNADTSILNSVALKITAQ